MDHRVRVRSIPFFRIRLLAATAEEIPYLLQEYVDETRALVKQITQICWYMRGGYTREEAWQLSPKERKEAMDLIEENIERTNKSGISLL
jgi:hypothetical protein